MYPIMPNFLKHKMETLWVDLYHTQMYTQSIMPFFKISLQYNMAQMDSLAWAQLVSLQKRFLNFAMLQTTPQWEIQLTQ